MNENNDVVEVKDVVAAPVELTAGEMLRNARTTGRRKREIPTIAKQLCIREEFLEALESGNYNVIPEMVYILGFARNYAMELGLNPDEIVEKIKKEMGIL
jgi:cytoskeletal protein RodZ